MVTIREVVVVTIGATVVIVTIGVTVVVMIVAAMVVNNGSDSGKCKSDSRVTVMVMAVVPSAVGTVVVALVMMTMVAAWVVVT